MGKPFGSQFRSVTQSTVLKTGGPCTFLSLHIVGNSSKVTAAIYNSGTSGAPSGGGASGATLTLLPKTTIVSGVTPVEVLNFGDKGVRMSDGLAFYMAYTSGCTAIVRYI